MQLYEELKNNKGLVSTALSKKIAKQILEGKSELIKEAYSLLTDSNPNIRASSAKIIEIVAESKPELVSCQLEEIVPCLNLPERQTRWVAIYILGCCALLKPQIAEKGLKKAVEFLNDKNSGTCLLDRSITYLGLMGSVSNKYSKQILPILISSVKNAPDRAIRIIEGIENMVEFIEEDSFSEVSDFLTRFSKDKRINVMKKSSAHP
jgi:HEAT repeat protein